MLRTHDNEHNTDVDSGNARTFERKLHASLLLRANN